eukprot:scaffold4.g4953.t1
MPPKRSRDVQQGGGGGDGTSTSGRRAFEAAVQRMAFLQAVMRRQYLPEQEAKEVYCKITGASNDAGYMELLGEINATHLSFAHFELRRIMYPGDRRHYLGFVNREADEESRRALKYRAGGRDGRPDLRLTAFFRMLLERIATADNGGESGLGYIRSSEAMNAALTQATQAPPATPATQGEAGAGGMQAPAAPLGAMSMRDRQEALEALAADGWLGHKAGVDGAYCLGPRSFLELAPYMLQLDDLPDATRQLLEGMV